jgi:hypothetical protein
MTAPKKSTQAVSKRPVEEMTTEELLAELDRVILRLAKACAAVAQ